MNNFNFISVSVENFAFSSLSIYTTSGYLPRKRGTEKRKAIVQENS